MQSFLEWTKCVKCNLKQFSEKSPFWYRKAHFSLFFFLFPLMPHHLLFNVSSSQAEFSFWCLLSRIAPAWEKGQKAKSMTFNFQRPQPFHPLQCFPGWEQNLNSRVRAHKEEEHFLKIQVHPDLMFRCHSALLYIQSGRGGKQEGLGGKLVCNLCKSRHSHFFTLDVKLGKKCVF